MNKMKQASDGLSNSACRFCTSIIKFRYNLKN